MPEIEAYAEYAISFHAEQINDDEKQDHGILGGLLIFYYGKNEYMKNNCSLKREVGYDTSIRFKTNSNDYDIF